MAHLEEFASPDLTASPKSYWSVLLTHVTPTMRTRLLLGRLQHLRAECKRRITFVYGETRFEDELVKCLRGDTATQNAERDRLRGICRTLKASVATMTYPQLQVFDPSAEALGAPSEPNGDSHEESA